MTRLDTLEPEFRDKVKSLLEAAEGATGRKWGVSDARRTLSRQQALYEQGRRTAGHVVTNARPGESAHNFGLAADLWPMLPGNEFDWRARRELFDAMGALAEGLGLVWGGTFRSILDLPHVEDPGWKLAQAEWRAGRLQVA